MNKYKIFFELFGKRMQYDCYADSEEQAKTIVKDKIIFHGVNKIEEEDNSGIDFLKDMFGLK